MIDPTRVAFDIDGVIADTMSLFLDIVHEDFNIDGIGYEDITCYKLADCLDLDLDIIDAAIAKILNGDYNAPLKPIAGAPEVLMRISNYRKPLLLVTARPFLGPISGWLENILPLDPLCIEVVATGTHERKPGVLRERNIACFVEDRLETCYALQDADILPVLFKQPWNREPHPFVEVGNWDELEALIQF